MRRADPAGPIRVGIGGWSYEPWRKTFYPPDVPQKRELEYASRRVTAIEINSTFYRLQKPAVFAKWYATTPDDFMFCVKAPRFVTHRKSLAEGAESAKRFIDSGIEELGRKLGPILWQLAPTHLFSATDLDAFLTRLPMAIGGLQLRHALNVRHESFRTQEFLALARAHGIAVVFEDDDEYPAIADITADFVYARLRRCTASQPTGYSKTTLHAWAQRATLWAQGGYPTDLPYVTDEIPPKSARDVFVFFINGAKERAPAAACHLIAELQI